MKLVFLSLVLLFFAANLVLGVVNGAATSDLIELLFALMLALALTALVGFMWSLAAMGNR